MAKDQDILRSGNHDGIEEYDNNLPRWWLWLFYLSVIFAALYYIYYELLGLGGTSETQLREEMAQYESAKTAYAAAHAPKALGEPELLALASKKEVLDKGTAIFATRCTPCHGSKAEGVIGPNLTDKYWIHGGKLTDIKLIIENGVLEKGMLAWKGQLSDDEINAVTSYVWSLRGSNPPNPKAPQGELVE